MGKQSRIGGQRTIGHACTAGCPVSVGGLVGCASILGGIAVGCGEVEESVLLVGHL